MCLDGVKENRLLKLTYAGVQLAYGFFCFVQSMVDILQALSEVGYKCLLRRNLLDQGAMLARDAKLTICKKLFEGVAGGQKFVLHGHEVQCLQ